MTTGPAGWAVEPFWETPLALKYSSWRSRITRTSSTVRVAAAASAMCCTTQSRAASGSNVGRGGSAARRWLSRRIATAAMRRISPTASAPRTTAMPPRYPVGAGRPDWMPRLDADALGEQLAVVGRVAEEDLGALGPLEVQVGIVLPGEADPAVDLDVLRRGVEVGLGAVRLGQGGDDRELVVVLRRRPAGVVRRRLRRLDLEEHVGALVLDGLEGADRPAELDSGLGVLDRHVEALLGPAHLLGGQADGHLVERLRQGGPAGALLAEQLRLHAGELQLGLLAGLVHRRQRRPGQARGVAGHGEERDALGA